MNQILKKIFFQFYVWGSKYNFANTPHLSAMYMLSLLLTIDLLTLIMLICLTFGYDDMSFLKSKPLLILLLAIVTGIVYFSYTRNNKYLIIYKEFNSSDPTSKKNIKIISILFIVFTLIIIFFVAFVFSLFKRNIL